MTAGRGFPQPDGIRSGVGVKPTRIPTLVLGGVDPVVRAKNADIVRISTTSDASGSIGLQFGRFDGQRILLVGLSNGGSAVVSTTSLNVAIATDWTPDTDAVLPLVWDAKNSVWAEIGERTSAIAGPAGPAGADFVDEDAGFVLAEIIWHLLTQGIEVGPLAREYMESRL